MKPFLPRPTVFRLLLAVAVSAILLFLITEPIRDRAKQRVDRCLSIADWHSRVSAEYRRNARGDPSMLHMAAWHDQMRREFEQAAESGGNAPPAFSAHPPPGWQPPAEARPAP